MGFTVLSTAISQMPNLFMHREGLPREVPPLDYLLIVACRVDMPCSL